MRQEGLAALRLQLISQRDVFYSLYRPGDPGCPPFVRLSRITAEVDPKKPSGRLGWGMIYYDFWLIESGFSPPVRLVPILASRDFARVDKLYDEAEELARNGRLGIWQFPSFASDLAEVARGRSDPPPLVLRELDDRTLLKISDRLLGSADDEICVAFSSGLREIARDIRPATRGAASEQLIQAYRAHSRQPVRRELLMTITELGDKSQATLEFLESVAADESDRDLKQMAGSAATTIRSARR